MHTRNLPRNENSARRLSAFALGVVVALFAWAASAQSVEGQVVRTIPQNIRWVNAYPGGASTSAGVAVDVGGKTALTKIPVNVASSTLGKLAKGLLGRVSGPVAVLTTVIDLANWHLDGETDKILDAPNAPDAQTSPGTEMWCISDGSQLRCTSKGTPENLVPVVNQRHAPLTVVSHSQTSASIYNFKLSNTGSVNASLRTFSEWTPDYGTGHTAQEISDQVLGDFLRNHPEAVNAVLIDPDSGAPIMTPELVAALNNLRKSIEAANGLDPGPDLVTDPNYPTNPQTAEKVWPDFCDWATTVCEWINWTKEEPEPEEPMQVPEEELDLSTPMGWDSGLGGGSCPAPVSTPIVVGPINEVVEFTFQPLCDLADLLRPLFIACAAIVAAFIVGGARRA